MTNFEKYFTSVLDGKIVACEKMKQISERLLTNFANPNQFHFDEQIAKRHVSFIEQFCKLPSGRIGQPLKLELFQKARLEALFGFVDDNNLRQYNECMIIEGRKNGKALALDTEIPTPNGFKLMRDIQVGDTVFGEDGRPTKVKLVSKIHENHKCYKVSFADGSFFIADAEHLWRVKDIYHKNRIKTTEELAKSLLVCKARQRWRWRVETPDPIQYPERELPIDAYSFGAWIGDGTKYSSCITCGDVDVEFMADIFRRKGHTVTVKQNKNRADSVFLDMADRRGGYNPFISALRELGVFKNKHIPDIYLYSSAPQRFELLRGLMDTDGYCNNRGECEFSQKNKAIANQVFELVSSLGIKATFREKITNKDGKTYTSYYVTFFTDKAHSCFCLPRKHARLRDELKSIKAKVINSIEEVESVPTKCIQVDNESHLYLIGRGYIPTHNTTETAAVELDMLVNDKEGAPQIYNIATMLDQAKLGFNAVHKMVRQSPVLSKHIKKRASDLYFSYNFGFIKALASNSNSLDGLDVHCAVIDELSAIKNRDIYDLIKQAMGARKQPLLFSITTNGFIRDGIFDSQYQYASDILDGVAQNDRFLPFIYELDDYSEWDNEECWIKANPGLDTIKSREYLREMVQKAKDDEAFKPTVLVKDFNLKQNKAEAWLPWTTLENTEPFPDYPFKYGIGGMDAADSVDLNSAKCICMKSNDNHIYIKSMYWLPEPVIDKWEAEGKRQGRDNVPYKLWKEKGYLRTVQSAKVDKKVFLDWFLELQEQEDIYILYIGYDPWHIDDSLLRAFKDNFGEHSMIPIRQGVYTLSQPMKDLKSDLEEKLIVYDNNPIDKWCLANTQIKVDTNGNIQPVKGLDPRQRIDGTLSLLDAYVVLQNKRDEFETMI